MPHFEVFCQLIMCMFATLVIGMVNQEEASGLNIEEVSVDWLISELDLHHRRPPWYDDAEPPNFFHPADTTFQEDEVIRLAYRSAKKRAFGVTRFDGQAALRRKVQALDGTAAYRIDVIAKKLHNTISSELREQIASWAGPSRRRKRQSVIPCLLAWVGMSYNKGEEYCQIILDIHPSKIQRLAKELFSVNLETDFGLRYLTFGNIIDRYVVAFGYRYSVSAHPESKVGIPSLIHSLAH
ncbi:hypothetical protein F4801DRAFT_440579 [Xylaria longipes]|nr:hypothetical protein F4801DRAFT_440579 [Xylaria longipes]